MEVVKQAAIGLLLASVLFVIIGLSLPKETVVERSIIINAPIGDVFNNVNNLKNHEKWDPWQAADKTMRITYGTVVEGTGALCTWTGTISGGTYTITESVTNRSINVELDLKNEGTIRGVWRFTRKASGVLVSKKVVNKAGASLYSRYRNLLTDAEISKYLTRGLKKLKVVSEKK